MFPGFLPRVGRGLIFCRGFYLAEVEVGKKKSGFLPRRGRGEEKGPRSRLKRGIPRDLVFTPIYTKSEVKNRGKIEKPMFNLGSVFKRKIYVFS